MQISSKEKTILALQGELEQIETDYAKSVEEIKKSNEFKIDEFNCKVWLKTDFRIELFHNLLQLLEKNSELTSLEGQLSVQKTQIQELESLLEESKSQRNTSMNISEPLNETFSLQVSNITWLLR